MSNGGTWMIHVENLTKYYDSFCAVDHINLDISKGEVVGLLGPNGAGKTTTLRMLTGFFRPSEGVVNIKGINVNDDPLEVKKIIGYLPESAPLYHNMLVFDYLSYIASIRNIDKSMILSRIEALADLCGLTQIMHKTISELSKGLKQRVGLAYSMMSDPEILILDEPTSGLDPNQIVEVRQIIRRIGKEKTVILSTHILSEAEVTCDRLVIINQGKIVADGSTQSLINATAEETHIKITLENADTKNVQEILLAIDGVKEVEFQQNNNVNNKIIDGKIICTSQEDIIKSIYLSIKSTDWILTSFYKETKTLETIFRKLTGDR